MALFSRKSSDKKASASKGTVKAEAAAAKSPADVVEDNNKTTKNQISRAKRSVLKGPRITEKAVSKNDQGVYVFDVAVKSTKSEIKQAVKRIYDVTPTDVRVVNHPGKVKRRGSAVGRTAKSRKAYVTLPAGKTIDLV